MAADMMTNPVVETIKRKYPQSVDLKKLTNPPSAELRESYPALAELIERAEIYTGWRSERDKKRGRSGHRKFYFWKDGKGKLVGLIGKSLSPESLESQLKRAIGHHRLILKEFVIITDDAEFANGHDFGLPAIEGMFSASEMPEVHLDLYWPETDPSLPKANQVVVFGGEANGDFWVYDKIDGVAYNATAFGPVSTRGLIRVGKTQVYKFPDNTTFDEYVERFAEHNLEYLKRVNE